MRAIVIGLAMAACAGRSVTGRHVTTVADGVWIEIKSTHRPELFGTLTEKHRLYFCSDKTGRVICKPAEFLNNDGEFFRP